MQQKSRLLKQQKLSNHTDTQMDPIQAPNKVFASEALRAANYKKANLNTIAHSCDALNEQQKTKLLAVLKQHEALFQGT